MSPLTGLTLLAFTGGPIAVGVWALIDLSQRGATAGGARALWAGGILLALASIPFAPSPYIDSAPERRIVADGPDLLSGVPIERDVVGIERSALGLLRQTRIRVTQGGELLEEQSVDGILLPLFPLAAAALWRASPSRRRARRS